MAAYRRVYDSRQLQADCQEPGSAIYHWLQQYSTHSGTQLANELNGQVLSLGLKAQVLGLGKELETVLSPPKTGGKLVPPRTGKNNAASRQ